jgi:acyl transferase domain-containing protein/NAD(P)-dependent dehydrogenase (short-subunit alcohol dehydrogenase family)/acyl carrier protein
LFPKADDLQAYWSNIKNGVDAITSIPERSHWKISDYYDPDPKASDRTYAQRGGFLSPVEFNPMEFGIAPKDIEATDTTQLLGMAAAKQALEDAGYGEKPFNRERTSVILGVTGALELVIPLGARLGHPIWRRALKEAGVTDPVANDVVKRISDSYVGWQENSFPGLLGNVAAGRIANRLDLGGTNCVVDAACASSMGALHLACLELTAGRADMAITGGIDTFNDIFMYMCFSKTPALSPSGDAKPFDRNCDGTILGEGLGMMVLKRLADAERDGDRIYAVIKGLGSSSDGKGNAVYAPRAEGQKQALKRAYQSSGVTPDTIELIEAHGTGTKVGDATELQALTDVFRAAQAEGTWTALGSVKSQIGHTKAAAGIAGMIKAAMALRDKVLPPTIKVGQPVEEVAPGRSPFYINSQKRPWMPREAHPRRAGVSAFGFGGTNFHCVLEEHRPAKAQAGWDGDVEILALGYDEFSDLRTAVKSLPTDLSWKQIRRRARESRNEFGRNSKYRLLLPITKETSIVALRDAVLAMLDKHPEKRAWTLPTGASFGAGEKTGKLGALFPGQGSQYPGMLRDLACQFPEMMEVLAMADRVFATEHPGDKSQRLSDFIYPHPAFTDEARRQQEESLKATEVAQPALGAAGLGALSVMARFGVIPEAAAGHSYGELPALCGAGRLDPESLHRLSNVRGRLMACRNGHSDRGAMLAVQANEADVTGFIREENLQLVIANRNSPTQFVLAGTKTHIQQAADLLAKRSIRARLLPVSAAFHSSLVADARAPFAAALEQIDFSLGHIPVYANTTAKTYPDGAKQARDLLASQMVKPVDFMAQIQAMFADGITTFIELGPGHVLSDLVQSILHGREVETIAIDSSRGGRSGTFDLAATLCRLASAGHPVDFSQWEKYSEPSKASANGKISMTVPLCGANYRTPRPALPPVSPEGLDLSNASINAQGNALVSNPHADAIAPIPAAAKPSMQSRAEGRPFPVATAGPELASALSAAQQGMLALQHLQEQTAQLHKQFLDSQESARRAIESLLLQRRELMAPAVSQSASAAPSPTAPVRPPAPTPAQPVCAPAASQSALPPMPAVESAKTVKKSPAAPAVAGAVLAVVADKTGYPAEMLDLTMGLDVDLGIDSIKRVEIMAALRIRLPDSPEVKPEHMGTLQTLQDVVNFLAVGCKTAEAPGATGGSDVSRINGVLLEVVADKTGYPVEMLNLDMGLDSDLGVDSIKRVEIMAAIRAQLPDSREIKPEHLGTLQTLRQIADFLSASVASAPAPTPTSKASTPGEPAYSDRIGAVLLGVVAEKTGYPVEMLNLDMGLDSDLGIDSIKRVEIMAAMRAQLPDSPEIKPEHLGTLQTLRQIVDFLSGGANEPMPAAANRKVDQVLAPAPIPSQAMNRQIVRPVLFSEIDDRPVVTIPKDARIWVTDDQSELSSTIETQLEKMGYSVRKGSIAELLKEAQPPSGLVILWPSTKGGDLFLKEAFRLMQFAAPSLRRPSHGESGILITVSRLDGVFGFGTLNGNGEPISGGLAGLAKTASHEWPEVHCKAIDLNPEIGIGAEAGHRIVEEMFKAGPVEVGISGQKRFSLKVETAPFATHGIMPELTSGDLVVVTGGARGITAATALQLARKHRLQLVLLGRSGLVQEEPEWLAGTETETEIKKALLARSNGGSSPKQIEVKYRECVAQREIREHLRKIRETGSTAIYRTVDVRSASDVRTAIAAIRAELGPVRGLIHGAGVLADRLIEDKTEEQFDLVYSTKVSGLKHLMEALTGDDLKLLALFSSYTGRFGRTGQIDYAAANEVLNKIAQAESRRRPKCRVVSFNWGPWNGGMVSNGLRKIFEAEGVGLIEIQAGAEFFVREISSGNANSVEVLALAPAPGGNGSHVKPAVIDSASGNVTFEREISVKTVPCLASHVLNGRAVLPAALMIEWLVQGAAHDNPGMHFHGFDDFKVLKGLILDPDASVPVCVLASPGQMSDGMLRVSVQLVSRSDKRQIAHACASILLSETPPAAPANGQLPPAHRNGKHPKSAYGEGLLFHGPHFQGIEAVETCTESQVVALSKSAPAPKQWILQPLRPNWITDPMAMDSSFQMMILWSWQHRDAASLPCALKRFRQFATAFPKNGSRIEIQITSAETQIVSSNIRFFDRDGKLLAIAEDYECVADQSLRDAFRRNSLKLDE